MTEKTGFERLATIQQEMKCGKTERNNFGKYNYRSAEGIYKEAKPHLKANGCVLTLNDDMVVIGGSRYIKATATLYQNSGELIISVNAFAQEPTSKKGMSSEQITGSTSSYARKYALNGLFLLDDGQDPDSQDPKEIEDHKNFLSKEIKDTISGISDIKELTQYFEKVQTKENKTQLTKLCGKRRKEIEGQ